MSRRLLLPLAVLALLATPAYASFTPTPGHYVGHAPHHGPYPVSFTLSGGMVTDWLMDNRLGVPSMGVRKEHYFSGKNRHNRTAGGHWTSAHEVVGWMTEVRDLGTRGKSTITIEWIAYVKTG